MNDVTARLRFNAERDSDASAIEVPVKKLIIAGWTGSDPDAMEAHIAELEKLGVRRPKTTPIFYRTAASLLTQADKIEVVGGASSGEAEPVLLSTSEGLVLTIGSDHTDREVEASGITISKQLCAKPIARDCWKFEEVRKHWASLVLHSWITIDGVRTLYQQGELSKMRHPAELMELYGAGPALPHGSVMYCGTLAVHGEIRPAPIFELELEDPVLGRRLHHRYHVSELPIEG